jgi:hypothetical protein
MQSTKDDLSPRAMGDSTYPNGTCSCREGPAAAQAETTKLLPKDGNPLVRCNRLMSIAIDAIELAFIELLEECSLVYESL